MSKATSRIRSQNKSSSSDAAPSRARSLLSNSARRSPKRWGVELESENVAATTWSTERSITSPRGTVNGSSWSARMTPPTPYTARRSAGFAAPA
jgi:hypothetical protein